MKVNLFSNIRNTTPSLTRDVGYFLDRIQKGNSKAIIDKLRAELDEKKRNEYKLSLPVVCFNATFSRRAKSNVKEPSGLMVLDFDDFDSYEQAKEFKQELASDVHVFAVWFSPNLGLKALYRIMKVEGDDQFKKVFDQVAKDYPELDESGKDISRACFESYDPDIYINLDAEVFSPSIILEEEIDTIGVVTNIPLSDENDIVNRLIVWFENGVFQESNRNTSIFVLSSAFNKFGVSKRIALEYAFRYAKSKAPTKEVESVVDSAYKNTADHNTRFFEDRKGKKRLESMVSSGRSDSQIQKAFPVVEPEKLEQEIKAIRKTINPEKFWEYNHKGEPKIEPYKLKVFLENQGYFKYYPDDGSNAFIFITKDDNFLNTTNEYQIKDFVLDNLQERFEIDIYNIAAERTKLFTYQYLSILDSADVKVMRDGADYAMLYYQNTALKVTKGSIEEISYNDLGEYVWENSIIKREYKNVDHHEAQFRRFLWLISNEEVERYNTFKSIIGYLLHSHKSSANNKAIILNDEKISDNPNGGSGKGLFTSAIGYMKNLSVLDGKRFDFNSQFAYQTVETDTQVLVFDDAKKNFNFEYLFSLITEGITLEYKGRDAIKLSVEDSPKVLISTNYTIKSEGGSFERRMFEVELASYFNSNYTPQDEFGCMLFDGWDEREWQHFDKFMINCLQYFLENGLVAYDHINLEIKKLINATSQEFVDFMDEQNLWDKKRINYVKLQIAFKSEFNDYHNHHWFSQRLFNQWLVRYVEFKGFNHESISINGVRNYEITAITEEAKSMPIGDEPNLDDDGLPF